jgi:hypothetical protein
MRITTTMLFLAAAAVVASGCYRATIETGRTPSGQTVTRDWAHSFIAGLVPPSTVNTAAQCPNGVARVQTQLSFLNMVANVVTFGIYTPMTVEVHCAAPAEDENNAAATLLVPAGSSLAETTRIFDAAATKVLETGVPAYVRFE